MTRAPKISRGNTSKASGPSGATKAPEEARTSAKAANTRKTTAKSPKGAAPRGTMAKTGAPVVGAAVTAGQNVTVGRGPQKVTGRVDSVSAEAQAHRSAMQASFSDMAAYLQEVLGQRLTAHIADVEDPQTVGRWIKGGRKPRAESEERVVAAYQIFQLLLSEEAPQTIRAWFLGLNPQLDDSSPAQALREGQFKQTMGAARAFLAGG